MILIKIYIYDRGKNGYDAASLGHGWAVTLSSVDNVEWNLMNLLGTKKNKLTLAVGAALWTLACAATAAEPVSAPETVIVKGQKIERPLDQTMSSVEVVTASELGEHADFSLTDVISRLPGMHTQSGNETWGIRGVPVAGFDDQGPATSNGAVAVYVDDAPQPHRLLTLSPLPLWDVEQVEIYRGAQSTLQGRNALGGAVIVQTRNPSYAPSLAARVNGGKYGERGASVAGGGAIVEGKLAGRFSADVQSGDGYIRNTTLNTDANPQRSTSLRGKLLFQPSANVDALLTLAHGRNKRGIQAVGAGPTYYSVALNTAEFDEIELDTATARIDYRMSPALTFTSITSVSRGEYDSLLDFDQRANARQEALRHHENRLFNQELRLAYKTRDLQAQLGAYYGKVENEIDDGLAFSGVQVGSVAGDIRVRSRSLFGELNWEFAPRWQLVGGLRYEHERNKTALSDDFASESVVSQTKTFNALLPKLGLNHRLAQDHMVGAFAQRGFRSGGVNVRVGTSHVAYDPEFTRTFEVVYRGAFLDKALRVNANAYYTDWKDQQVAMLDRNDELSVSNAGHSRMRGIELGADYRVNRAWRLLAGLSYSGTRYLDFVAYGDDLSGNAFIGAPRRKANLGLVYRADARLQASFDLVYQDDSVSSYLTTDGRVSGVRRSDAATLANANLSYRIGHATLTGYVRNLFDRQYITNNQAGRTLDVSAPRTFGVALRYDL